MNDLTGKPVGAWGRIKAWWRREPVPHAGGNTNFVNDKELLAILEIGARFMAAAGEMRIITDALANEELADKQRKPLYGAWNQHHATMWRAGCELEDLLAGTDWWRSVVIPLPQQDRANMAYIVLFNQIAALLIQLEEEKSRKYAALRRLA